MLSQSAHAGSQISEVFPLTTCVNHHPNRADIDEVKAAINNASELVDAKQFSAALRVVESAAMNPVATQTQLMHLHMIAGRIHYELNDYSAAIQAFEAAIDMGCLHTDDYDNLRVNIAQLLLMDGQRHKALKILQNYALKHGPKNFIEAEALVEISLETGECKDVRPKLEKWFEGVNPKTRRHYDLMLYFYSEAALHDRQTDMPQ